MAGVTPLRVVHLVSGDLWAGAEVATLHLLRGLARRPELRVEALLLNPGPLAERLAAAGIPVRIEPERGRPFPALARAVRRALAGAGLVHAHRYKEDVLAALAGRPWLATQHGRPEPFSGAAALRMRVYRAADLAVRRLSARRVVAVSAEVAAWLAPRVGARRVALAWNGIEDPAPGGRPVPWQERPARVGVLARLTPVKDVALALDAVAACDGVALEIVGDGPERSALEARAAASGAGDRIRFVGFDPDPLPRLARWRALLVTSHHEGNPISVLEAMALGTPVVHPALGGVAEIARAPAGVAVAERSAPALAAALGRLLQAPGEGEAAAAAARARYLGAFTADRAAARMAEIYRELAPGAPSRPG